MRLMLCICSSICAKDINLTFEIMSKLGKNIRTNNVSEHCQLILDDFFNFCDGKPELCQYVITTDIREPIPPDVEQIKKMFGRCKRVWADYCDFIKLPRESRQLFVTKAKKEWHRREEELKQQGIQKRKRSHSVDS